MPAWSSGIVSACGVMGREIESRLGIHRVVAFKGSILAKSYFGVELCR
jgi:hypothetical protein